MAPTVLAQPIRVGSITLPNRFVMGSMHTSLEGHPDQFDRLAAFYAERAKGGAALIVTGGFAPNSAGRVQASPSILDSTEHLAAHRKIATAVHAEGGRISLQILHAGRYANHAELVAPSPVKSPISRDVPAELTEEGIRQTIRDYARCASLAREAGYDGVEIMGSEGYLISQFLAPRTNKRGDSWGGALENRARFPLEVVQAVRQAVGADFLITFRISVLDLVEGGLLPDEVLWLGRQIAAAGADNLSTGIGWHEAVIPTIAGVVPHAAFAEAIGRLKAAVPIPVTATNRINLPEVAERLVAMGQADMVSLARPFLADPAFARKVLDGRPDLVTVCLACNQGCLDRYFTHKPIGCTLNPKALHEAEFARPPVAKAKRVAVVGAGVAGLACAGEAARRGHAVTLFDRAAEVGGHLRLAARVPGKADYGRAVDALANQLKACGVSFRLGQSVTEEDLLGFDEVVAATGIEPRKLDIPGAEDARVVDYRAVLSGTVSVGKTVVIVGGGPIAHDVALFLASGDDAATDDVSAFQRRWGIGRKPETTAPVRSVTMVKRSSGGFGKSLGKTTGWILRQELADFGVRQIAGATYLEVTPEGLRIRVDGAEQVLAAESIVVCAGQVSEQTLAEKLAGRGLIAHLIGGARLAAEINAERAMEEGVRLGSRL